MPGRQVRELRQLSHVAGFTGAAATWEGGGRARNGDFGSPVSVCDSKWKCFNSDVWKDNITPQRAVHGKLFWENVFGQRR